MPPDRVRVELEAPRQLVRVEAVRRVVTDALDRSADWPALAAAGLLALAVPTEQGGEGLGLAEVAGRAGIKLSQLRAEFGSTLAILAAHIKEIDRVVLAGGDSVGATRPADVISSALTGRAP